VLALANTSGTLVGTLVGGDVSGVVQYFGGDVRGWSGGGRRNWSVQQCLALAALAEWSGGATGPGGLSCQIRQGDATGRKYWSGTGRCDVGRLVSTG
jgi:hypothetical protein